MAGWVGVFGVNKIDDWIEKPLGQIANLTMGQSPDSRFYSEEDVGLPFLQGCAEFGKRYPNPKLYCSQVTKIARRQSILFSVRAPVGKTNLADCDYIIGRGLAAITGTEIDQSYLEHFIKFSESGFRNASQGSTFEAINSSVLAGWKITFPADPRVQARVAGILSTIDKTIGQTEAIIAKQKRIKTGLMQDLLTRGIDEHGNIRSEATHAFKESPLGRIPVEWGVSTLIDCVRPDAPICYGILMPGAYHDDGVPVIKVRDILGGRVLTNDLLLTSPVIDRLYKRSRLKRGDILVTIRGTTGRIAEVPVELDGANITQDTARIRLLPEHSRRYFYHLLQAVSVQDQISLHTLGQAVKGINIGEVKKILITTPCKAEQDAIAQRLDDLDAVHQATLQQLSKQLRQKAALMQDLLTGKVRVTPLLEAGA